MMIRPQAYFLVIVPATKKKSDWLRPWRVTMFAPSIGTNNNVNNKLTVEIIYLLPPPTMAWAPSALVLPTSSLHLLCSIATSRHPPTHQRARRCCPSPSPPPCQHHWHDNPNTCLCKTTLMPSSSLPPPPPSAHSHCAFHHSLSLQPAR